MTLLFVADRIVLGVFKRLQEGTPTLLKTIIVNDVDVAVFVVIVTLLIVADSIILRCSQYMFV